MNTPSKDTSQSSRTDSGAGSTNLSLSGKRPVRRESSASPPRFERGEATAASSAQNGQGSRSNEDATPGSLRIKGAASVRMDSLAEWGVPPLIDGPCNPAVEVSTSVSQSVSSSLTSSAFALALGNPQFSPLRPNSRISIIWR